MKKITLFLTFALVAIFAWAGNTTDKEVKSVKQNCEQESTERNEALRLIHDIDYYCKKLAANIKAIETSDSLSQIVWKHRNKLNKLSEDTLEEFINKMISMGEFLPADITAKNTATWKDSTCKEVAATANPCIYVQNVVKKIYEDIYWKKQRVFDELMAVVVYCKDPADTPAEAVKRLLDTPEVRSYIGKQHLYNIGMLKGTLEMLTKINSKNKKLMRVTDEELLEMFASDHQTEEYDFHYKVEDFAD